VHVWCPPPFLRRTFQVGGHKAFPPTRRRKVRGGGANFSVRLSLSSTYTVPILSLCASNSRMSVSPPTDLMLQSRPRHRPLHSSDYPIHSPLDSLPTFRSSSSSISSTSNPPSAPSPPSSSSSSSTTSSSSAQLIFGDPRIVAVLSGVAGVSLALGGIYGYRRFWRRIRNADYVTTGMLVRKRRIKGVVTRWITPRFLLSRTDPSASVGDGGKLWTWTWYGRTEWVYPQTTLDSSIPPGFSIPTPSNSVPSPPPPKVCPPPSLTARLVLVV